VNPAHRLTRAWLAVALAATLALAWPRAALGEPTEQEVKAALIFNITRFVEWPTSAFRSPGAPLVVAILGQDDVSDVLGKMLLRKTVNGHTLEVRRVRSEEEARECQVLYVASSEKRRVNAIVKTLSGGSTLTVADIEHFAEQGGHVNLVVEDQRVRLFVNPRTVRESHLSISAKLLSLAQLVGQGR
jgi:hypothetical protein